MAQMGLLDDPNALWTVVSSLLNARGGNFLGHIGQAGLLGQQALTQSDQLRRRNEMMDLEEQQRKIQLDQLKQAQADDAIARGVVSGQEPQMSSAPQMPSAPQMSAPPVGQNFMGANPDYQQMPGMQSQSPQPPAPPSVGAIPGPKGAPITIGSPGINRAALAQQYNDFADRLQAARGNPEMVAKYRQLALSMLPKLKDTKTQTDPRTGQRVTVNFYEDGSTDVVPFAPDLEKASFQDVGGSILPLDPITGVPRAPGIAKTVSPDARLSSDTTKRGQDITDARERIGLAYNTGYNAPRYGFEAPQVPGVNLTGLSPQQGQAVAADVAKKQGEATNTVRMSLPDLEASTSRTLGLVDDLLKHPGFKGSVGAKSLPGMAADLGHPIGGTATADWYALRDQLTGKQFMEAYQNLKGGGQITEVEGKKATDAIAAMQTSQSEEQFRRNANIFKDVLRAGLARARAKGGVSVQQADPLGIR